MDIINLSWDNGKFFTIKNMKEFWGTNGVGRQWSIKTNKAKKHIDKCLDVNIHLGYIAICYTDYNY